MAENNNIENWFKDNPDITQIVAGLFDYNGVLRGKRVPVSKLDSLLSSGLKMPRSVQVLDIFGEDIEGSDLVFKTGDQDATAFVTGRMPLRLSHMSEPTALLLLSFRSDAGAQPQAVISPHEMLRAKTAYPAADASVLLCGVEMEFTLLSSEMAAPALSLATGEAPRGGQVLSALHLDDYDAVFSDISAFCKSQNIKIDTITSEAGEAQFEVTFQPKSELCVLAEDILLFKYVVKAIAKSNGIKASFMAKPLEDQPGNGMHVHASLINPKTGANLFDEEADEEGQARLYSAIGGLLSSMKEASLILAPMINSYRRLVPASHAPINICWGQDNRTAAVRVPAGASSARRLEMRVAGADANPYLLFAWMNLAIFQGLSFKTAAPPPITGSAYEQKHDQLASGITEALALAESSEIIAQAIGDDLLRYYVATKRQEVRRFSTYIPPFEFTTLSEQL